jgi:two-component system, NarL family, invasion response regulator UvrY
VLIITYGRDCSDLLVDLSMSTPQSDRPAILIVDHLLLVRLGLREALRQEYSEIVIGEAETGEEVLVEVQRREWDLIILDISLPDQHGLSVLEAIRAHRPEARVLIMLSIEESLHAVRAMELGASGYVSRNARSSDLIDAARQVLAGKQFFDESISRRWNLRPQALHANLSAREYQVMLALAGGRGVDEIATELSIAVGTVSTYKRRILNKLHLNSTADLVRYVIDNRLSRSASG